MSWYCSPARNLIVTHESTKALEQEEKAQELAQKVARATLDKIKGQLESDLARIRSQLPTKESRTRETALDMKYLKERQQSFGLPIRDLVCKWGFVDWVLVCSTRVNVFFLRVLILQAELLFLQHIVYLCFVWWIAKERV